MATTVTLTSGTLPGGAAYCPATYQALYEAIVTATTAYFDGTSGDVIISATHPTDEQLAKPWIKWDATTDTVYEPALYFYVAAINAWVSRHPETPSGYARRLWVGTTTQLETYDGGAAGVVGAVTGPMWEVDASFDARFLCAPGTFAASGQLAVNTGTTSSGVAGEDRHALTEAELAAHDHDIDIQVEAGGGALYGLKFNCSDATTTPYSTEDAGSGDAHNNLPPMWGVYVIKRTARIYYLGAMHV